MMPISTLYNFLVEPYHDLQPAVMRVFSTVITINYVVVIPRICCASDHVKTVSLGSPPHSWTIISASDGPYSAVLASPAPITICGTAFGSLQLPEIGARMFSSCCQHPLWSVGVQSMLYPSPSRYSQK